MLVKQWKAAGYPKWFSHKRSGSTMISVATAATTPCALGVDTPHARIILIHDAGEIRWGAPSIVLLKPQSSAVPPRMMGLRLVNEMQFANLLGSHPPGAVALLGQGAQVVDTSALAD